VICRVALYERQRDRCGHREAQGDESELEVVPSQEGRRTEHIKPFFDVLEWQFCVLFEAIERFAIPDDITRIAATVLATMLLKRLDDGTPHLSLRACDPRREPDRPHNKAMRGSHAPVAKTRRRRMGAPAHHRGGRFERTRRRHHLPHPSIGGRLAPHPETR
jgi:hypothetical protein